MADKNSTPEADKGDQPTTHSKKAQMTAIVLVIIVVIGLIINSVSSMSRREKRDASAMAEATTAEERAQQVTPEAKMSEFVDQQKEAAKRLDADAKVHQEQTARSGLAGAIDNVVSGGGTASGPESNGAGGAQQRVRETVADVDAEFAVSERKRALAAAYSGLNVVSAAGQAGATGAPAPRGQASGKELISGIDQRIAQLSAAPDAIAQRQRQIVEQAKAAGVQLPAEILARFDGGGNAPAIAQPMPSVLPAAAPAARPQAANNQGTFGELAKNRVARNPADAGPRPGEKILPTSTIISAIMDTSMMSDYTGSWVALVQRPVYDVELENILLPAGTKIFGKSMRASEVNEAIQARMGSVPLWAIRPDGKRIDFKLTSATDTEGVAALKGTVDRHFLAQFMGIGAYALIGLGPSLSNYGSEPQSSRDAFVREATGRSRDVGRSFAEKYLNIVPTNRIPAGTPIKIILEDDLYVTPWEDINAAHFNVR